MESFIDGYMLNWAPYLMVLTVVLGQVSLYNRWCRDWEENSSRFPQRPNPVRFVLAQVFLTMFSVVVHPVASMMKVLILWFGHPVLLIAYAMKWYKPIHWVVDALETHRTAAADQRDRQYAGTNMPGHVVHSRMEWEKERDYHDQLLLYQLFERFNLFLAKTWSAVSIVVGVVVAPFGLFVPKAQAQNTKQGAAVTKQLTDAETWTSRLTIGGAVMGQLDVVIPTVSSGEDSLGYIASLRKMQLDVGVQVVPGTLSMSTAVTLALPSPVFKAQLDWAPSEEVIVSAGRILSDVGMGRNPPPHVIIPVTYPDSGITSSLNDHGVKIRWRPTSWFTGSLGAVSGEGVSATPDASPDGFAQLNFHPTDGMTLGLGGQSGEQQGGWRHTVAGQLVYSTPTFTTQTEVVTVWDTGVTQPTVAWWHMGAIHVAPWVQLYTRVEGLHQTNTHASWKDLKLLVGANFIPWAKVKLRAALGLPLQRDPTIRGHFAVQATF